MARLRARDVMTPAVLSVSPDASLLDAVRLFADEGIHGAPVVGDQGEILGVVTTSDLLRAQEDERDTGWAADFRGALDLSSSAEADGSIDLSGFEEQLGQRTVAEVMTKTVVSVSADAPVAEVARTLRESRIHRVWVQDHDRQLCGVVSALDLMQVIESTQG